MKHTILLLALLVACTSDEEKMSHLRSQQAIAEISVQWWQNKADSAMGHKPPFEIPRSILDSLNASRIRLDLANRDLNKFMGR